MADARPAANKRARHGGSPQPSSQAPEDGDDQPCSGVAMAVAVHGSRCGVAWFDDGKLSCMEAEDDTTGPFRHQLLHLAKLHAQPAVIYVSSKADAGLVTVLRAPLAGAAPAATASPAATSAAAASGSGGGTAGAADAAGSFDVRTERSTLFLPRAARGMLEAVHVRGTPAGLSTREHLHRLNTMLSLSREQQVCAAGALLAVLAREGRLAPAPGDVGAAAAGPSSAAVPSCGTMELASISEVSLDGYLLVDPGSMAALQIFQEESHPAAAMGIGQPKEGFSVFGCLNRCVSPPGRRLLRLWFSRPIVNLEVLSDRLDGIHFFMQRPDALKALRDMLRKVKDTPRLLARLRGQQTLPDPADFAALQASLAATLLLRDMLVGLVPDTNTSLLAAAAAGGEAATATTTGGAGSWGGGNGTSGRAAAVSAAWAAGVGAAAGRGEATPISAQAERQPGSHQQHQLHQQHQHQHQQQQQQRPPASVPGILFKAAAVIRQDLVLCHNLISGVLDLSGAAREEGHMVAQGVSPELDELKEQFHALPDYLTRLVEAELRRIPPHLAAGVKQHLWSIAYMPQVGFVMRLEGGRLAAHLEEALPDYSFAFQGGGGGANSEGVFYHCDTTRRLNDRYGDMQHRIQDMESGIACQLTRRLAEHAAAIAAASEAVAELDCVLSLAQAARDLNLCRPQLTSSNELHIEGGRHLLTEQLVDTFIPNDTHMHAGQGRIQVITGPNFSGKSCYAKQVALITFLAHVGSFVPATSARIGLTDRIFTRVASREAAAVPQSTFMIDLSQIAAMLRLSTERSLCIIDEFGKGTLAADGVGLLCATLRHFAGLPHPPRVVLCTHFSEVLQPRHLPRCPHLTFLTMSVLVEGEQQQAQQAAQAQGTEPEAEPRADGGRDSGGGAAEPQQAGEGGAGEAERVSPVPQHLVFLYRLVRGHVAPSFGVYCAQMAGVPPAVLQRARHVIAAQASGAALQPDLLGKHVQRSASLRALVQQLAALNVHDGEAAKQLAAAAVEVA